MCAAGPDPAINYSVIDGLFYDNVLYRNTSTYTTNLCPRKAFCSAVTNVFSGQSMLALLQGCSELHKYPALKILLLQTDQDMGQALLQTGILL